MVRVALATRGGRRGRRAGVTHVVVGAVVPVVTRGDLNHDRRAAVMTVVVMRVAALHVGHGATVAVTAITVVVRGAVVPVRCVGAALRGRRGRRSRRGRRASMPVVPVRRGGRGGLLGDLALLLAMMVAVMPVMMPVALSMWVMREGARAKECAREHDESSNGEFLEGGLVHGLSSHLFYRACGSVSAELVERPVPLTYTQTPPPELHSKNLEKFLTSSYSFVCEITRALDGS